MSKSFEKYQKRRLRSSYVSVVISIALVLFLLGIIGLLLLQTKNIADYFKEQAAVTLYIKNEVNKETIAKLQAEIDKQAFTKSSKFTSKEEAAEIYKKENGEDFMAFLGYNPLQNSIDLYPVAEYVTPEKMLEIENIYKKNPLISEVSYDKSLIDLLTKNVRKISIIIFIFSALATMVVIVLINSAIRLSVYSKRFTIKTMQMVGATKRFIRKPFIWNSLKLGFFGALLALAGLATVIYYFNEHFPQFGLFDDKLQIGLLFGSVFLIGILISWLSTFFAMQRFLNLRTDELYY